MTDLTKDQAEIQNLKSRILDTQDALHQTQQQAHELSGALTAIAQIVGILPDENGNVSLETIVEAVRGLIPSEKIETE